MSLFIFSRRYQGIWHFFPFSWGCFLLFLSCTLTLAFSLLLFSLFFFFYFLIFFSFFSFSSFSFSFSLFFSSFISFSPIIIVVSFFCSSSTSNSSSDSLKDSTTGSSAGLDTSCYSSAPIPFSLAFMVTSLLQVITALHSSFGFFSVLAPKLLDGRSANCFANCLTWTSKFFMADLCSLGLTWILEWTEQESLPTSLFDHRD